MIDGYEPIGCSGRNLFCQKDGDGREINVDGGSGCQAAYIPASPPESASAIREHFSTPERTPEVTSFAMVGNTGDCVRGLLYPLSDVVT
jgi:hypothetical protein